jgi:DNA polymerase-1
MEGGEYYFDYLSTLGRKSILDILSKFTGTIFMHNAKFDMHFMAKEGVAIEEYDIHCTMALGRVQRNDLPSLSLYNLGKTLGFRKSDQVMAYMNEHKLYEIQELPYKKKKVKNYFFAKVPIDVMQPYAELDAKITYLLGLHQIRAIKDKDMEVPEGRPKLSQVAKNEKKLTKVLFDMEKKGVKIDLDFTKKARLFEVNSYEKAAEKFKKLTGVEFKDSNKVFAEIFQEKGISYPNTQKGNPSFTDAVLEKIESPIAETIREYRGAHKKAGTYYANFIDMADENSLIHASFLQSGAKTGRFVVIDPALQTLNKEKGEGYKVRRCFVPRENSYLFSFDYKSFEYNLMLEYSEEMDLIEEVKAGKDIHEATGEMMGVERKIAKTINFMLLYGGGVDALAEILGIERHEATELRELYFHKLPSISSFIKKVMGRARSRGYIFNWLGRVYYFNKEFVYRAPNYLIQGGCADIIKMAMVHLHELYKNSDVSMLLQVHDELIFEIPKEKLCVVEDIKRVMENVYPYKYLPMKVDVEWSAKSWQDMEKYNDGVKKDN